MQKKLILLIVTAAFVLTIIGAASADRPTNLTLEVNDTTVNVGESVLLTSRLTSGGTSDGVSGETIHFFVDGSEIWTIVIDLTFENIFFYPVFCVCFLFYFDIIEVF
ncbi:MAG: hypothetical protein BME94_03250 [Methanobacteriales archaeon Met13]